MSPRAPNGSLALLELLLQVTGPHSSWPPVAAHQGSVQTSSGESWPGSPLRRSQDDHVEAPLPLRRLLRCRPPTSPPNLRTRRGELMWTQRPAGLPKSLPQHSLYVPRKNHSSKKPWARQSSSKTELSREEVFGRCSATVLPHLLTYSDFL